MVRQGSEPSLSVSLPIGLNVKVEISKPSLLKTPMEAGSSKYAPSAALKQSLKTRNVISKLLFPRHL
jgi:hypothetical protein